MHDLKFEISIGTFGAEMEIVWRKLKNLTQI